MYLYSFKQIGFLLTLTLLLFVRTGYCLAPFQLFIDITPKGGVLRPPAGDYAGPAVIKKQIIIEGNEAVTIDVGGEGTVLSVMADGVEVRGLKLINSGGSHNLKSDGGSFHLSLYCS
jgi:nitrous oxidase accessory protein